MAQQQDALLEGSADLSIPSRKGSITGCTVGTAISSDDSMSDHAQANDNDPSQPLSAEAEDILLWQQQKVQNAMKSVRLKKDKEGREEQQPKRLSGTKMSTEEIVAEMEKDLNGFGDLDELEAELERIGTEISFRSDDVTSSMTSNKSKSSGLKKTLKNLKEKRESRLAKVRRRIRAKEDEKREEEEKKKQVDMSEEARKDRAYDWYKRLSFPDRETLKEKVSEMPTAVGFSADDVDLLAWNKAGTFVNPNKMRKLSRQTSKSSFFRKKKKDDGSDSDSD